MRAVLITTCLAVALLGASASAFRVITVAGTREEVAFSVGNATKAEVAIRLARPEVADHREFVKNTTAGKAIYDQLLAASQQTYPQYLSELEYLADGAGVAFEDLFLVAIGTEIAVYVHQNVPYFKHTRIPSHCTDVISQPVAGHADMGIHGHNEDGGEGDKAINYMVNATIYTDSTYTTVEERFMAYAYAGTLAGYAWGWNHHGLFVSENIILNLNMQYDNPPGFLFGRALLAAKSISDAMSQGIIAPGCAAGNVNMGEFASGRTVSFEYDAQNRSIGVKATANQIPQVPLPGLIKAKPYYYHTNIYEVLQSASWQGTSSYDRLAVLNSYPAPNTTMDIRTMLGDTSNKDYPVYRNGTKYDHGITLTTTIINYSSGVIEIFDENPKLSEPVLSVAPWNKFF